MLQRRGLTDRPRWMVATGSDVVRPTSISTGQMAEKNTKKIKKKFTGSSCCATHSAA